MSLRWGAGDTRWFDKLDHDEQVRVLALERLEAQETSASAPPRSRGRGR